MSPTLQILQAQFPGQFRIPVLAAGTLLGLAQQTTRNQLHLGTFPVRTQRVGGRRFVRIDDLARALDAGAEQHVVTHRRTGAPKKSERLAAQAAGVSVTELRRRQEAAVAQQIAAGKGVAK